MFSRRSWRSAELMMHTAQPLVLRRMWPLAVARSTPLVCLRIGTGANASLRSRRTRPSEQIILGDKVAPVVGSGRNTTTSGTYVELSRRSRMGWPDSAVTAMDGSVIDAIGSMGCTAPLISTYSGRKSWRAEARASWVEHRPAACFRVCHLGSMAPKTQTRSRSTS